MMNKNDYIGKYCIQVSIPLTQELAEGKRARLQSMPSSGVDPELFRVEYRPKIKTRLQHVKASYKVAMESGKYIVMRKFLRSDKVEYVGINE